MGTNLQATVMQMNQQAMAAYGNLQFQQALQSLQQAQNMCQQYRVGGPTLGRTLLNMGVVEVGGFQNNAAGLEHFKQALCIDPTLMLDPLSSTPEVETLFNLARNQARTPGACQQAPQPMPQPVPQPQPMPQPVPQPQPLPQQSDQLIRHQPVTQQQRLVPVPIYAEIHPNAKVGTIILFYRTVGERIFQQVQMKPQGRGYAAMIGCDVLQTFDPTGLEYYIAVLDPNNQLLGTAGTEAQPLQVAVVQQLTTLAPSLPDSPPPRACGEECPPWDQSCNACKQMGDVCTSSTECCKGMVCKDEMCTEGEGKEGEGESKDTGPFEPIFRLTLNAGTGAGVIAGGDVSPYNQTSEGKLAIGTGFAFNKLHFRINPMFYITPDIQLGATFRGDASLNTEAGAPAFAASILANLSYRLVGEGYEGFHLLSLFGLGWANFLHKVPYQDCRGRQLTSADMKSRTSLKDDVYPTVDPEVRKQIAQDIYDNGSTVVCENLDNKGNWDYSNPVDKNFYRNSGMFGIEAGIEMYYWFGKYFGINAGIVLDFLVPTIALNFDAQAGFALRF
ncbi:MAG: hypothetical protein PHU25_16025 [Deltaproteobacteria bacterium]|nr:hypothetical protein [Deltaproteobacteria bacterium]